MMATSYVTMRMLAQFCKISQIISIFDIVPFLFIYSHGNKSADSYKYLVDSFRIVEEVGPSQYSRRNQTVLTFLY